MKLRIVGETQFQDFWDKLLMRGEVPFGRKVAVSRRKGLSKTVFETELFGIAQSIAETEETLYHGPKHTFLDRLNQWESFALDDNSLSKSAIVIELSAMIQIYAAVPVDTFADFAKMLYEKIMKIYHRYKRGDVVCDRILADSVKTEIRESRGQSSRKVFIGDSSVSEKISFRFYG